MSDFRLAGLAVLEAHADSVPCRATRKQVFENRAGQGLVLGDRNDMVLFSALLQARQ